MFIITNIFSIFVHYSEHYGEKTARFTAQGKQRVI